MELREKILILENEYVFFLQNRFISHSLYFSFLQYVLLWLKFCSTFQLEVMQVLKHAEKNNLFFVVKGFGGFAQSWKS